MGMATAQVKAYVSSTFQDLQACRAEVTLALRRLGVEDVAMEYYVADSERPLTRCLRDAADCDLYIGLFAWRYGHIPPDEERSITELEYRAAVAAGKPALVFILSEDASWPRSSMDRDATRIESLREELGQNLLCSYFSAPQELAGLVTAAVHNQLRTQGKPLPEDTYLDPAEVSAYCMRIVQQYGRLDLETLTPSQFEDQLRIELNSVFVEPDVREDLPVLDLPKHLQKWLAVQENLGDTDLPDGIGAEELDHLRHAYSERPRKKAFDLLSERGAGCRVVFLGDPGAGKSTLVRYLTLSLADPAAPARRTPFEGCLPILIELKSYEAARKEQGCTTFGEFYGLLARSEGLGLDEERLDRYLSEDGRAVAFFDGLDEIFDPAHRAGMARQIAAFAARYPKAHIIVTSRIIGYSRNTLANAGFTHATLQDLDTGQIGGFLAGWYALALHDRPGDAGQRKDRLLAAIADSRSIGEMAGNPLLLTILAIIGRHQELPRERWKVYDYAATVLVERWDVNRHLRNEDVRLDFVSEDDKKELLRRVALLMQTGAGHGGNYLTGEELRREFETYLSTRFRRDPAEAATIAQAMIRQFRERNFILSRYGGELYGFVHRAFLEFFCAEAYRWQFERDQEIDLDFLKAEVFGRHWDDPSWHEVLRLIGGTIRQQWTAQIVCYLVDEVNLPWPWRFGGKPPWNIALAAQCLAEGRTVAGFDDAARRILIRIIQLLEHGTLDEDEQSNVLLRSEILPALASVGPAWPGREIYLRWYLARGVRLAWIPISEFAAQVAARLFPDDPGLIDTLDRAIDATGDPRITLALADVLASLALGRPEICTLLLRHADSAGEGGRMAVDALTRAATDPGIRALLFEHATDHDECVRRAAVDVLASAAPDAGIRALLLDYAVQDSSASVRMTAIRGLASAAGSSRIRSRLISCATGDDDENARQAAVSALGSAAQDPRLHRLMLEWATHDSSGAVRRTAIGMLASAVQDPGVRAVLIERAADDDETVRLAAIGALAPAIPEPRIRDLMLDRARYDDSEDTRQTAMGALAPAAGDPQIRAFLLARAMYDYGAGVRRIAISALASATSDSAVRGVLLSCAYHDSDDSVRETAVRALASAVGVPGVRVLMIDRARRDNSRDTRLTAISALASAAGDPEVRVLLLDRAIHDYDVDVRQIAFEALALVADPHIQELLDRACHPDKGVRETAISALASAAGDPEVRALLLGRAVRAETGADRQAAIAALAARMAEAEIQVLLSRLADNDEDEAVCRTVIEALDAATAEPEVRAILLDRARHDPDGGIRRAAAQFLAAIAAGPGVAALLSGRAASSHRLDVSSADWRTVLSGKLDEPAAVFLISDAANQEDIAWIRQLAVRIASCSAGFDPEMLPSLEGSQGTLFGYVH